MTTPSKREKSPQWHRLAIAAAFLLSQGKRPREIASTIHKGEPEVSVLLKFAREKGYLSLGPAFLRHNVNDVLWEETMREYFGEANFTGKVEGAVPKNLQFEAHVMWGSYVEFIHGAAMHVRHLLQRVRRAGVMWGRTIHLLVENIKAHGQEVDHGAPCQIECVPLCGDPIHLMNRRRLIYSASWLAVDLENALRLPALQREEIPCLIGVPAYLSRAVRAGSRLDDRNWVKFLHQIPGYQTILGRTPGRSRLADRLEAVITGAGIIAPDSHSWSPTRQGVGTDRPSTGDLIEERLQQEGPALRAKLPDLIYGDIGGVLIPKPGVSAADRKLVDELNAGWTGLGEGDLQQLARAAGRSNGAPGIIVVASSADKAELLYAAIQRGLVNRLVVDEPLMHKLESLAA